MKSLGSMVNFSFICLGLTSYTFKESVISDVLSYTDKSKKIYCGEKDTESVRTLVLSYTFKESVRSDV